MTATSSQAPHRAAPPEDRPGLAVLTCEITPYRLHFHRRLVRELPEFKLWTILFRDSAWSAWKLDADDINLVKLAEGDLASHGRGAGSQLRRSRAVLDFLRGQRIGAVMVNGYDELPQLRAIRWCRSRGIPVLLWADSNIASDRVTGIRRVLKRLIVPRIIRRCDALLPCGSLGRDYFLRYGASANRIFYSPYEPDYAELEHVSLALIESAAGRFGLKPGRRRFVVSSRLVPHKRVDLAIDAFLRVSDRLPDWDLVVLGDGPQAQRLREQAGAGRVIFTGFLGEQDAVTAVYRNCHVLVHPSNYEPWALVINEAAAAGLAIISTDVVGAAAELVRDGVNGRIIPINDLAALETAMLDAAAHVDRYRAASGSILAEWRRVADPVEGLRRALTHAGALTDSPRTGNFHALSANAR